MRIKNGMKVELRLATAHGERFFDAETAGTGTEIGTHRDWAVLTVAKADRGIGETLFEVDIPLSELGKLVGRQTANGVVDWSVDSRKRSGFKIKPKKGGR